MINVAIIGAGAIANTHIQAYQEFKDRAKITAIVDLYPEKAQSMAEKFGLDVRVYENYHDLIQKEEFDLASICLPPFVHAQAAIDLLEAGKHVLVEKPMAPSLEECDLMNQAASRSGKLLSVVAQNRFKNPLMKLKQVLDSGLTGEIIHARVDSFWWRGQSYYDLWWRGTWEKEGGGCTMNHAVHHIDLFQWMMGMPDQVQALVTNLNHQNSEVEDFSTAIFMYDDGRIGQVSASLVHHGEEQSFVFQGEKAMVAIPWRAYASKARDNGFPDMDVETTKKIDEYYQNLPDLPFTDHVGQIDNVLSAVRGEEELLISGEDGRNAIELVMAIYQAGITGEVVQLPLGPESPYYTRKGVLEHATHFHEKTKSVENFATDEITFGSDYKKEES